MNTDYIMGVGLICKSIGELIVDKNAQLAFTDFMKGLGSLGLHSAITTAMQAPPGQAVPFIKFQSQN